MSQINIQGAIEDDDWDQRPDNICKKCGYHKNSCVCKIQRTHLKKKQSLIRRLKTTN